MSKGAKCMNSQPALLVSVNMLHSRGRSAVTCEDSGYWRRQLPQDMDNTIALVFATFNFMWSIAQGDSQSISDSLQVF